MPNFFGTSEWGTCVQNDIPTLGCTWTVIQNVINAFTALAGIVALFLIVYAGIKYAMSGGNKEKVESAKKTLTFAIIGLIFIITAYLILVIISQLTGIDVALITTPPGSTK